MPFLRIGKHFIRLSRLLELLLSSLVTRILIRMVLNTMCATGELMLEKKLSFSDVVSRVATKGGITEEGTKVIYDRFPEIANQLFEKTLEKRRLTVMRVEELFN